MSVPLIDISCDDWDFNFIHDGGVTDQVLADLDVEASTKRQDALLREFPKCSISADRSGKKKVGLSHPCTLIV